jgi:hypothetical protein
MLRSGNEVDRMMERRSNHLEKPQKPSSAGSGCEVLLTATSVLLF